MTLEILLTKIDPPYVIAGTLNETFPVTFPFPDNASIVVFQEAAVGGVTTTKTEGVDYTLTGAGDPTGGLVTWIGTPTPAADLMHIHRWVTPTQPSKLPTTGRIPIESIETGLDRTTMLVQQILDRIGGVAFVIGFTGFLGRLSGDLTKWDAQDDIIDKVGDATSAKHAMNKQTTQALISLSGALPAPGAGATGHVLTALDAASWAAKDRGVPVPVAADVDKLLTPTAAGEGNYSYKMKFPTPVAADIGKRPRATAVDLVAWDNPESLENLFLNGAFDISQRLTTFTAATNPKNDDGTWLIDQWLLLSDGNDIVDVARIEAGTSHAIELTFNSKNKAGILQILEHVDTLELVGNPVSVALEAKITGAAGVKLKMALVTWSGAQDAPTIDLVNVWGAQDTDPTYATSWAEVADATLTLTAALQTLKLENQTIGSVQNVGVLIWVESSTNIVVGDKVVITDFRVQRGAYALPFKRRRSGDELRRCQRYLFVTKGGVGADELLASGYNESLTRTRQGRGFPVTMRKVPTNTFLPAVGDFRIFHGSSSTVVSAFVGINQNRDMFHVRADVAAGLTVGEGCELLANSANAMIISTAEF